MQVGEKATVDEVVISIANLMKIYLCYKVPV